MARIKIQSVIDHLAPQFRQALADTLKKEFPQASISDQQIFRAFKRAVGRKFSSWERVPDHLIELDDNPDYMNL